MIQQMNWVQHTLTHVSANHFVQTTSKTSSNEKYGTCVLKISSKPIIIAAEMLKIKTRPHF